MTETNDQTLAEIARRLELARPLCFLDLETTGTSVESDRIIEIATATVFPDATVERIRTFVNPEVPIPKEATAIHGISDADVANAPTFRALAPRFAARLGGYDLAGFNLIGFDLRMLNFEFKRAGIAFDPLQNRVVDAMTIFHQNEKRDLEAAVRFYTGKGHKGHRAADDVAATIDVLAAQLERYADLPRRVDALDEYCRRKKPNWITADGKVAWKEGQPVITFGKHSGKSLIFLARTEPDYLRWIIAKDFADDFKRLADDALNGKFPVPPTAAA